MKNFGHTTVVNILIGVVIGFFISYLFGPQQAFNVTPLRFSRTDQIGHHHNHDAHDESDVDDAEAPEQAIHFHANGSDLRMFILGLI